ncbi:MAG: hypothetical protein M3082_18135 [Candidatus Dormibacteraeota bacterium]|nr:hypothetical protein [Candidatus Dormibacteraeota bacterium]
MRNSRTPRLERWTRQLGAVSEFIRAFTVLVEDLTDLVDRSRSLVVKSTVLALAIGAAITLR